MAKARPGGPRCTATAKTTGERCQNTPVKGAVVCEDHGGAAPQVRAAAAVRAEAMRWGLGDTTVDPGEVLLRLLTQAARRADRYAEEIERLVAEAPSLEQALVGDSRVLVGDELEKVGEYVRGMALLEAQERDRCATFAAKAIAAGLAERQVRLAEQQGALIHDLIRKVFDDPDLGLSPQQRRLAGQVAVKHLRLAS